MAEQKRSGEHRSPAQGRRSTEVLPVRTRGAPELVHAAQRRGGREEVNGTPDMVGGERNGHYVQVTTATTKDNAIDVIVRIVVRYINNK